MSLLPIVFSLSWPLTRHSSTWLVFSFDRARGPSQDLRRLLRSKRSMELVHLVIRGLCDPPLLLHASLKHGQQQHVQDDGCRDNPQCPAERGLQQYVLELPQSLEEVALQSSDQLCRGLKVNSKSGSLQPPQPSLSNMCISHKKKTCHPDR
jgi:hypothetical protein